MTSDIVVFALVLANIILAVIAFRQLKRYLTDRQKLKALRQEGRRLRDEIRRMESYRQVKPRNETA